MEPSGATARVAHAPGSPLPYSRRSPRRTGWHAASTSPPSLIHVERRILAEDIGGGDQDVLRQRARRQSLAGHQAQGERQDVITVAVDEIGHRAKHHAAAVVGIDLFFLAGAAMDVAVEPLADDDAIALPTV